MRDQDWGPWIDCDGTGGPRLEPGVRVIVTYDMSDGAGLIRIPGETNHETWPGFLWRWKRVRVGWFKTKLRRVCDDPSYAPIMRYRVKKPPSAAVTLLAEIAANPPSQPIPDGDADRRVPKRVKA